MTTTLSASSNPLRRLLEAAANDPWLAPTLVGKASPIAGCASRKRDQAGRDSARLRAVMFCPDCNANLDDVPVGASCPHCGGQRRSANVSPESIRAVATVRSPTIVTESNFEDSTRETIVSSTSARSTSSSGSDGQTQHFEGRPTQHEENVAEALHRLKDKLNNLAGSRVWQEQVGHDDTAVDGTLTSTGGRELKCQVTRVERGTLPTRGHEGHATSREEDEALAASIITAIESKLGSADPDMVLVLDANDAPAYTDNPRPAQIAQDVMRERSYFRRWAQVWLVAPTVPRTMRLDPL